MAKRVRNKGRMRTAYLKTYRGSVINTGSTVNHAIVERIRSERLIVDENSFLQSLSLTKQNPNDPLMGTLRRLYDELHAGEKHQHVKLSNRPLRKVFLFWFMQAEEKHTEDRFRRETIARTRYEVAYLVDIDYANKNVRESIRYSSIMRAKQCYRSSQVLWKSWEHLPENSVTG